MQWAPPPHVALITITCIVYRSAVSLTHSLSLATVRPPNMHGQPTAQSFAKLDQAGQAARKSKTNGKRDGENDARKVYYKIYQVYYTTYTINRERVNQTREGQPRVDSLVGPHR